MRVKKPVTGTKQCLIWDREHETMPRPKLEKLQLERLQRTVERCYERVPFYREKMDELGVKPEDIVTLKDVSKLPFTTKYDLRENYPFKMFAEPMERVVRLHASSGTTGKPVVAGYTAKDLDTWAELIARVYTSGGVTNADVVHNAYGYGLFTGGMGFHYGAEKVGATIVPVSGGLTKRQVMLWQDFGASVLCSTPSYALVLAEQAAEMGIDTARDLNLRVGFFGAEPWTLEMKKEIEEKLNIEAFDIYGLTELIGPGVSSECPYHDGLHINEDHFLVETIDPDTGEVLPPGTPGEMVLTSLTKEAFPVLRFRTRDRTIINQETCACGRTTARMMRVTGRTDDMLIIRGVNVFPSQIESVILSVPHLEPQYVIVVDRGSTHMDDLEVLVECSEDLYNKGAEAMKEAQEHLSRELHQVLALNARIKVVGPKTLQRSEGKAKRVVDLRELSH
ncbi:phenylacetate--CoA ligase family protein [Paradesulfitobacterium ferrireducens]|uniref:phenylacetate--CoA ligase family protein n=1 Tax=Paradesulfitobacterium ferrireducens TaxID=2816476 RepID=UPI001A908232|nr:phenylacetate--CoA ligase [Paradesulfitobacterium ferrireducens]